MVVHVGQLGTWRRPQMVERQRAAAQQAQQMQEAQRAGSMSLGMEARQVGLAQQQQQQQASTPRLGGRRPEKQKSKDCVVM